MFDQLLKKKKYVEGQINNNLKLYYSLVSIGFTIFEGLT